MTDLRSYMSSTFIEEEAIIQELETALGEVSDTFSKTFDKNLLSWPYEIRSGQSSPPGVRSQTTVAMILCSILAMTDYWTNAKHLRASSGVSYWPDFPMPRDLCQGLRATSKENPTSDLVKSTRTLLQTWDRQRRGPITESTTFGDDDPMSLSWALDLLEFMGGASLKGPNYTNLSARVVERCREHAEALGQAARASRGPQANRSLCVSIVSPSDDRKVGDSSYLLVRFAALLSSLKRRPSQAIANHRAVMRAIDGAHKVLVERFESQLHEQLSFAEIVDSRFDPTELAFCLEGILLIRPDAVTKTLFDRVMSVLRAVQEATGYWRSETPMIYNARGDVLFTVSVESANAILASFALYDTRWSLHGSVASEHMDLLKRYWKWLKARKSIVQIGGSTLRGWHSEHVNDPSLIHLWETSQVAEFLVNFRDQLKRHMARTSLRLAACSIAMPTRPKAISIKAKADSPDERWAAAVKAYEPVTAFGPTFRVYDQVGKAFVAPRSIGSDITAAAYSMLLYGPPGTGKTTVAGSLSWALNYPLITLSVSDFLADGSAAIEARAKDLFNMLRVQPRSVVLFDETDQFMLDRDLEYFRDQETVFQFLTPGMLTKLNDLRTAESVIFIMATNYAERIDRAIKRQGRIRSALRATAP